MPKNAFSGLHIAQRAPMPLWKSAALRLFAVLVALLIGALFITCLGLNPLNVYNTMIKGALEKKTARVNVIKNAIPLAIVALGITLAFRMKFWNIGAEGQICVGAIAASFFAYNFEWPMWLMLTAMALAGFVAGGLYGLIPAFFKTKYGTNETLFTLMMNYIAAFFIQFLREGPSRDPSKMGFPAMPRYEKSARLPSVLGVHAGWIFALAIALFVLIYLRYTKQGYELTVVGDNITTARYAGMPVNRVILRTMFLSAGICGLSGMVQASGADKMLTDTVAGGDGFTAIIIAWLARLSPVGILIIAILFGVLEKGCATVETTYKLSSEFAEILQGIILFCVLGAEFFITYQVKMSDKEVKG